MIRIFAITERSQVAAIELAREDTRVAYPGFLFSVKPGVERLDGPSTLPVFANIRCRDGLATLNCARGISLRYFSAMRVCR
jgi:hypothetical protein